MAYLVRRIRRGLWAVVDTVGINHANEPVLYVTTQREAERRAGWVEAGGPVPRACCYPVVDGSPQGAPCLLARGHGGRCRADVNEGGQ